MLFSAVFDNGTDAAKARELGAVGIGLCRTEHMFFQPEALRAMRQMLLAPSETGRRRALQQILPMQREEFKELFRAMNGLPVTIRLLDPPLHEFLPKRKENMVSLAEDLGLRDSALQDRLTQLHEVNPMMGHRGCRIGVTMPEIYQTQVRAIFEAACHLAKEDAIVMPEVMIPLVSTEAEIKIMKDLVIRVAKEVENKNKIKLNFLVGTMIELPRAAIKADDISRHAEFFSFGTNDLTQTTFGISRDDSGKFLNDYIENKIFDVDPFVSIDDGVGDLIEIATKKGRKNNKKIKLGICGEHGGDPKSIEFCARAGLDYVSCSPYRVPIARLAAAQAQLKN